MELYTAKCTLPLPGSLLKKSLHFQLSTLFNDAFLS